MENGINNLFKLRFKESFSQSNYTSMTQCSVDAGCSPPTVSQILSGKFDDSRPGPGFFAMSRLSKALETPIGYWAGQSAISPSVARNILNGTHLLGENGPPTIEEFCRTYVRGGKRLSAFNQYASYFDVYDLPDDKRRAIQISQMGSASLFSIRMGGTNIKDAQTELDAAPAPLREAFYGAHKRAYDLGIFTEVFSLDRELETRPAHIKTDYTRTGARVIDDDGREKIIIYCIAISS